MTNNIPHLFRCPISLDLFTDPVTLSTGQTYERACIVKWLADGNLTCPVTMQHLYDTSFVPNNTLRLLINQWLLSGCSNHLPTERTKNHSKYCTKYSLSTLKHVLQSPETSLLTRLEVLKKIRILSVESDSGHVCLIEHGFFSVLLQLLFHQTVDETTARDSEIVELVLDCLLSLATSTNLVHLNNLRTDHRSVSMFIQLLHTGNFRIKTSICNLIEIVTASEVTQELCMVLGKTRKVFQMLVSLLSGDFKLTEAAMMAVSGLCSLESNRNNAISEGVVEGLISYLSAPVRRNPSRALATVEELVGIEAGKKAMERCSGAVPILVPLVFKVSLDPEGSEHAVGALLLACSDSPQARAEAVRAGVLKQLLLLLQSQSGAKAKAKARALLKLLRALWPDDLQMSNFNNAA